MKNKGYIFALLVIIMALVVLIPYLNKQPSAPETKSTWLWDTDLIIDQADDIVRFSKEQGVKIVFLQIGEKVAADQYRSFISKAKKEKIEVHALNGRPGWALYDNKEEADEFLNWVKDYNASSKPEEQFAGVQFDVEPYLLKQWKSSQKVVLQEWMRNMRSWSESGKEAGLSVGAAVPFWLNGVNNPNGNGKQPMSDWMIDRLDYLAIMAYRDKADQIYEISEHMLSEADSQGKKIWVGVEVAPSQEGEGVSFYAQSDSKLDAELNKLVSMGDNHVSFAGIAVHSYEAWRTRFDETKTALRND
ncbi:hypothetical protein [Paenibacillus sp. YPG26]|uniref:hypothetical protein n=1 Tax=Paenibacillus sp. YPG26 TaxID=2878915 RepID=UPI0020401D7D|nr:hypothetical protein [Paenibacillus sp. YPG26]USB35035.1 hypothetical protein LDO05_07700 [Paenibacillus sp. YPG26]